VSQNLREVSTAAVLGRTHAPPHFTSRQKNWGYVMAVLGAALFSMKAVVIKLAYGAEADPLDPIVIMVLRMGFALPVYIAILIYALRKGGARGVAPKHIMSAIGLGALGYYLCALLDFTGLLYITAQLERLLLFTYPIFVVIIGALFMGVRVSGRGLACIALAYSGIALIFAGGDIATGEQMWRGVALVLGCALCFATFQILAKPMIDRMGGRLFTCLAMIAASTTVFLHFIIFYGVLNTGGRGMTGALSLSPQIIGLGFILGIFCTVIPSFLMNIANGRIGAQAVSTLGMVSPIFTIIAAIYLLGEPFGLIDMLGTALTLIGIGLYTYFDKRTTN
jgi:drug/metabolite transporter (DMT)-like permease